MDVVFDNVEEVRLECSIFNLLAFAESWVRDRSVCLSVEWRILQLGFRLLNEQSVTVE